MKKSDILEMKSIGYYSGLNGLEIKEITEIDFNYYVLCVTGAWYGEKIPHRVKIEYTANGEMYFRVYGYRIPLDECLRM